MPDPGSTRVAVLGAGPAGLGAAWLLAQRGFSVIVLEQQDRVGGNAGSFEISGMPVDFGSHRFHPAASPEVLAMVSELLGDDLIQRPRHGRIRLMGRWLHFPLRAHDLAMHAPPRFAWGVFRDLLSKMVRRGETSGDNFANILRQGLGPTICEEFYFPYARKIWGMDPASLSPVQARKRVSSSSIGKMLKRILGSTFASKSRGSKGIFYYPRQGFGQICESLCDAARHSGADIRLSSRASSVVLGNKRHRVEFEGANGKESIEVQHLWSTIPVTVLARLIQPAAPHPVLEAARTLRFRGMLLIYLVLETRQFTPFDAHYLPGADLRITRLSEPKNYSGREDPEGVTVLCAELPCQPGEAIWKETDEALGKLVEEDLAQAGIPIRCNVSQVIVRRLPQAYPLYPIGYGKSFDLLDNWVEGLDRVLSFGRQGLYAHDNTHHALYMARAAAGCLRDDGSFDHDAWSGEREVFATHVVED
jgi:protoporphyrinogen oxidase